MTFDFNFKKKQQSENKATVGRQSWSWRSVLATSLMKEFELPGTPERALSRSAWLNKGVVEVSTSCYRCWPVCCCNSSTFVARRRWVICAEPSRLFSPFLSAAALGARQWHAVVRLARGLFCIFPLPELRFVVPAGWFDSAARLEVGSDDSAPRFRATGCWSVRWDHAFQRVCPWRSSSVHPSTRAFLVSLDCFGRTELSSSERKRNRIGLFSKS